MYLNAGFRESCESGQVFSGGNARKWVLLKGLKEETGLGWRNGGPFSPVLLWETF